MQAEVGTTNLDAGMNLTDQAKKLMECIGKGPGYNTNGATGTLGNVTTAATTVDGTPAVRATGNVTVAGRPEVAGDSITVIAVQTKPVTYFFGAVPIGDTASQA